MAYFNEFPNTRTYDGDLGWLIATVKQIIAKLGGYDEITFADPIYWNITTQYPARIIVRDGQEGNLYLSKKPVPAGITLTNNEYWENLGFYDNVSSDFVINVADYGALGVSGADYTSQIEAALEAGSVLYFPAGTYSFGTIAIAKPVYIFGEGERTIFKPLHRIPTSNQYKTMIQATADITIDNIKFVGDNSITTQTGEQYLQTSIIQSYNSHFRMTGCFIDQIYDDYHVSQGTIEFYERNGLLLYVHNAKSARIDHCTFESYGGEELIWISRDVNKFGDNVPVYVHDNRCVDRVSIAGGGTLDGGSVINVLGGDAVFANNSGNNYYERGSLFNILANNIEIRDNFFTGCELPSVFDCCEGYYGKSKKVWIHDNYFDDNSGVTTYGLKVQAVDILIENNHIEGSCPIKTYNLYDPTLIAYQVYIDDSADWIRNNDVVIRDNDLVITGNAANYANSGIALHQSPAPTGSRGSIKKVMIDNNNIRHTSNVTSKFVTFASATRIERADFNNNTFPYSGAGAPSASHGSYIEFADTASSGDLVVINNNNFNDDTYATNRVIQTLAGNVSLIEVIAGFNLARTIGNNYFVISSFSNISGDYNLGFNALK